MFIMGGAVGRGNTTGFAEFNFWVDPEAARVVFEAGIPITMVGLDVCGKTALFPEDVPELERLGTPMSLFIRDLTRHYHERSKPCYLNDPLAVAAGLEHAILIDAPNVHVDNETVGEFTHGASVADLHHLFHREPNARVCLDLDSDLFRRIFWERVVLRKI